MISRFFTIVFLAFSASANLAGQAAETDLSLGYVIVGRHDSTLSLDPMTPDSFVFTSPGRLYALKGEYESITFSYSDGKPTETQEFYEVRFAGSVVSPEFPAPPISKLPRREDGWLPTKSFVPRAVSYAPLAETMEVVYPFYVSELMEGTDFYKVYDLKPSGLLDDSKKKYVDKRIFKLPFENGTEKTVADSVLVVKKDSVSRKSNYLGQYESLGLYLVERISGKQKWYDLVRKSDGGLAGKIDFPTVIPAFSAEDGWLTAATSSADGMVFYLQFYRLEEDKLVEHFTVRMPLQKPTEVCWEAENILLLRLEQTGVTLDAEKAEQFLKIFITLSN